MGTGDGIVLPIKWNPWIVALSFVVGIIGSYTTTYMLYMIEHAQERRNRIFWLFISCLTFGGGCIWSLHFTGMMALQIGVPVNYNLGITILSFFVAVFGAVFAFYIKFRNIFKVATTPDVESFEEVPLLSSAHGDSHDPNHSLKHFFRPDKAMVLGGFFKGTAIFAMHYTGMVGMRMDKVSMHFNPWLVFASLIPAWIISVFSLNGLPRALQFSKQILFSFLSTLGVFSLHYIGMYSATFVYRNGGVPPPKQPNFTF